MLFWLSWWIHHNRHSRANAVYEAHLLGRASAQDVVDIVFRMGIENTGHGRWLLKQVGYVQGDEEEGWVP